MDFQLSPDVIEMKKSIRHFIDNTVVASFRYKYSQYIDGWTSVGMSRKEPFLAAGLRISF